MREIRNGGRDAEEHLNKDEEDKLNPAFREFNTIDNLSLPRSQCQCLQRLSRLCYYYY